MDFYRICLLSKPIRLERLIARSILLLIDRGSATRTVFPVYSIHLTWQLSHLKFFLKDFLLFFETVDLRSYFDYILTICQLCFRLPKYALELFDLVSISFLMIYELGFLKLSKGLAKYNLKIQNWEEQIKTKFEFKLCKNCPEFFVVFV